MTVLLFALVAFVHGQAIRIDPVVRLCQSPGMFAMTFDQGPSIYSGAILDALGSRNVKASFHPVVTYLNEATTVANLQRAASEGHCIGLSIEPSVDLSSQSDSEMMESIDSRADTLKSVIGIRPYFLRIPNVANMTDAQINLIKSKGYVITTYNLDSYDYSSPNVLQSFKNVLDVLSNNTKGAFISVQRDYIPESANATPDILDYVMGKGYNLVTLDKCVRGAAPPKSSPPKISPGSNFQGSVSLSAEKVTLMKVCICILGVLLL